MKKKIKLILILTSLFTLFTAVPAMANKVSFDFTVPATSAGRTGHTAKSYKPDTEQNAYITVTNFTLNGFMILFVDQGSVNGVHSQAVFYNEANRSAYINNVQVRPYIQGTAGTGTYYLYYDNYGSKTCWIKGRYDP